MNTSSRPRSDKSRSESSITGIQTIYTSQPIIAPLTKPLWEKFTNMCLLLWKTEHPRFGHKITSACLVAQYSSLASVCKIRLPICLPWTLLIPLLLLGTIFCKMVYIYIYMYIYISETSKWTQFGFEISEMRKI